MGSGASQIDDEDDYIDEELDKPKKPEPKKKTQRKSRKGNQNPATGVPKTSKDELLADVDFKYIDNHAFKAPHYLLYTSFVELADYLTDEGAWQDDLVKVRSVFRWITSYNLKKMQIGPNPPANTVLEYLSKINCNIGNHANLFYILCQMVDVPCVIVDGVTKSSAYKLGEPLNKKAIKAQWNAVYVRDEWRLIDVYWATTCVEINTGDTPGEVQIRKYAKTKVDKKTKLDHREEVDECYFFTEPYHLIWTHLPDDEKWQLLPHPIKESEFEKLVYVRERMHELEVDFPAKKNRRVNVFLKQGIGHIELDLPPKRSKFLRFKFAFYRSKGSMDDDKDIDVMLNNCVKMNQTGTNLFFDFDVPVCGTFNFEIYGKDANHKDLQEFDLMCTYCIRAPVPERKPLPLPDNPEIGWGPNMKTLKSGIKPVTHKRSKIITDDGILEIKIQAPRESNLTMELRSGVVDDAAIVKYAILRWEEGHYIINTRLPKAGHYIMKINARNPKRGTEVENVLNYIIKNNGKQEIDNPYPHIENGVLGSTESAENLGVRAVFAENIIRAKKGKTVVEIAADEETKIMHEVDCTNEEGMNTMVAKASQEGQIHTYDLGLPVAGEYSLNIYEKQQTGVNVLYAFLILSTGKPKKPVGNKSDRTKSRGSLSNKSTVIDLSDVPVSNKSNTNTPRLITKTFRTKEVELYVPAPDDTVNIVAILTPKETPTNTINVAPLRKDGSNWFNVPLASVGEYKFDVMKQNSDSSISYIAKYKIRRLDINASEANQPEQPAFDPDAHFKARAKKKEEVTQNLEDAIESQSVGRIENAMIVYAGNVSNNNQDRLLEKAEQTLKTLAVRKDLLGAYEKRHIPTLERMLNRARANNFNNILDSEIVLASRLLDRLNNLKSLRKEVMMKDSKALTELKRYANPPAGVYEVMSCTLLLLGHPPWDIDTWAKCRAIISRTGKDSIKFKMADFDPRDVPLDVALDGRDLIDPFTEKQIYDVSPTAAAFHYWDTRQLTEVETTAVSLGGKNFAPDEVQELETIAESENSELNGTDVLPLTEENLNQFDNTSKQNGHVQFDPSPSPKTNGHGPPPTSNNISDTHSRKPSTASRPLSDRTVLSNGNSRPSPLPPITPRGIYTNGSPASSNASLTPRGQKIFNYRTSRKSGFVNLRKLGIIPDWKG
ncbi:uncharacterized protein LOC134253073 [Saccostrea cucullata]|uniref:uncharacterized protein LOC134253073 n=1 Tax=Saccostrea cuccullata TaxID=36930 RepID=UPI002ED249ED